MDPNPTVGALPWYKSPVQVAQTASFISGLVALSPKNGIFTALGLTDPATVTTDVTGAFAVIALLAGLWGLIARARSKTQPLTITQANAEAHPATAVAIAAGTLSTPMAKSESKP